MERACFGCVLFGDSLEVPETNVVVELRALKPWQAMAQAVQQRETALPEGEVATPRKVEQTG